MAAVPHVFNDASKPPLALLLAGRDTMARDEIDTAERLVAWMRRMNLTPTTAAEHLGHKRGTITRYANGTQPVPEHVARQAAIVEASRNGLPFESRPKKRDDIER